MKRCRKCGLLLPEDNYNRNRAKRDGLDVYCRDCRREYMRHYEKNKRYSTPDGRDRDIISEIIRGER